MLLAVIAQHEIIYAMNQELNLHMLVLAAVSRMATLKWETHCHL